MAASAVRSRNPMRRRGGTIRVMASMRMWRPVKGRVGRAEEAEEEDRVPEEAIDPIRRRRQPWQAVGAQVAPGELPGGQADEDQQADADADAFEEGEEARDGGERPSPREGNRRAENGPSALPLRRRRFGGGSRHLPPRISASGRSTTARKSFE